MISGVRDNARRWTTRKVPLAVMVMMLAAALLGALLAVTPAQADDSVGPGQPPVGRTATTSDDIVPGKRPVGRAVAADDTLLSSRARLMRTVKDLVALGPRSTGTVGGRETVRYLTRRLRAAGMDKVWVERATSYSWKAKDHSLKVAGRRVASHPIGFSLIGGPTATGVRTLGPKGLTAPVVDLTANPNSDVKGKIAIVDLKFILPLAGLIPFMEFINDPDGEILDAETLLSANPFLTTLSSSITKLQDGGAVGMIGVLSDYFESNKYLNEYYRRTPMKLPGMWITNNEAVKVRRLLAKRSEATMRLTTVRREVVARSVVGVLKGKTNETVMVQSHHDSLTPGAVEDATGVAEVVGLAEYYGKLARTDERRAKTLMFSTFDTHFTGYHAHNAFIDKYVKDPASPYKIVANTTIEHIGKKGVIRDGQLVITDQTEPRGFMENLSLPLKAELARIVLARDLRAMTILNGTLFQPVGLPTDASFIQKAGVPTVSLIAGPIYLYDVADNLKAVDRAEMRPMLFAQRDLIDALEATPAAAIGLLPVQIPLPGLL